MSAGRLLGGRYQVGELLGYGGMAEVHHGRDQRLGRDVAIKLLRSDLARDATFQMRFGREAQNAAALNHPAIVAVYDTGEEIGPNGESQPYIVMEYVNGRTLKEVLTAEGPLMPRRALEVSADVCAALEFSHRHGIIHRDIKPGNVMLTQTGQVKVMDFGIARALASGASTMTQTSAVIGTAQYLSPEQARGEPVDARSDVYATGCVVFELVTGHPPFVGDNPVSVAYQHVREDPKPPSASNRDVSPDIDAIVLKALAKNPLNRYQSAAEMRADLLRAAAGRPVLATPIMGDPNTIMATQPRMGPNGSQATLPARVGNPQRRRDSAWVMVALSLLGVIAVVALGTGLYLTNRTQMTNVPVLNGLTVEAAKTQLQQAKLVLGAQRLVQNDTCMKGQILTTTPKGNSSVAINTAVNYDLCAGAGSGSVPLVSSHTEEQARTELASAGFTNVTFKEIDGVGDKGTVLSVDPAEQSVQPLDTPITVSISKGNQAQVPSVVGESVSQARSDLGQAGFKNVVVHSYPVIDPALVGKIVKQQQDPSTVQFKKDQVTIYVGILSTPTSPATSAPPTTPPPSPSPSPSPSPGP